MAQIINPGPSFGGRLGEALGTGIGSGLESLAKSKMKNLQDRAESKKLLPFVEDQETADWLQTLPPETQFKALQWLQKSNFENPQQSQQFQQQLQPVQQQLNELVGPRQEQQKQMAQQQLAQRLGGAPQQQQQMPQQQPLPQNLLQQQQLANQLQGQQQQAGLAQQAQQQPQQQVQPQPGSKLPSLKKALAAGARSQDQSVGKPIKLSKAQDAYVKGYDTAAESIHILDQMEELLNTGKVSSGDSYTGYKPYALQNEESQQFADLGDQLAGMLAQQLGTPTNAKIKFTQGLKPNLSKKTNVQRKGIERLRQEAMDKMGVARQRLPQGYFGEEQISQQQMQRQPERQEQRQEQPQKEEETAAEKVFKESPENLNWFAKKAREEEQQGPKEEGWFDYFLRNIQRGGAKAQEVVFGKQEGAEEGFERIDKLTGGKHKFSPEQKAAIKKLEMKNEFLMEPQSFTEKVSDRMFESLPIIGLTGIKGAGNIGKALLQDLGASVASTATQEAGGGTGAQFIASLAGGAVARNLIAKAGSAKNLMSIAKEAETKAVDTAEKLGKNINVESRDYKKKLSDIHEALQETSALDFKEKENTLSKFNQWIGDAYGNKLSANKVLERKNELETLFNKSPEEVKPFLSKAKDVMMAQLNKIGSSHPEFDSAWKRSEYLNGALKYPEQFSQTIADIPYVGKYIKNPLAYALASGAQGLYKGKNIESVLTSAATGLAAGVPIAATAKAIEKNWPKIKMMGQFVMAQDPKVRELTLDVMRNVIENNKGNVQRSLIKLSKATEPYAELI